MPNYLQVIIGICVISAVCTVFILNLIWAGNKYEKSCESTGVLVTDIKCVLDEK